MDKKQNKTKQNKKKKKSNVILQPVKSVTFDSLLMAML